MRQITDGLQSLVARDFQFTHPRDSAGDLVAVIGIRPHRGVIDILQLFSEDDADAVRVPGDEPDVLFPKRVLWRATGSAQHVIEALLALAQPTPDTSVGSSGCWIPTHAGSSSWLAASA